MCCNNGTRNESMSDAPNRAPGSGKISFPTILMLENLEVSKIRVNTHTHTILIRV